MGKVIDIKHRIRARQIEKMKKDKATNCYALLQTLRHRLDEIRRLRVC